MAITYGTRPAMSACAPAWCQKAGLTGCAAFAAGAFAAAKACVAWAWRGAVATVKGLGLHALAAPSCS